MPPYLAFIKVHILSILSEDSIDIESCRTRTGTRLVVLVAEQTSLDSLSAPVPHTESILTMCAGGTTVLWNLLELFNRPHTTVCLRCSNFLTSITNLVEPGAVDIPNGSAQNWSSIWKRKYFR